MPKARQTLIFAGLALGVAACDRDAPADQNFTIDNIGNAEVETLPADESSTTPSNALVNGTTDDPGATTADNQTDSY